MSYFIVQVQTNFEKYVSNILANKLTKEINHSIKSIYALDQRINFEEMESINLDEVRGYLNQKRLRNHLNNMRYTYSQMKFNPNISDSMKKTYKQQIKELTQKINQLPKKSNEKKTAFICGYIIIETYSNSNDIPSDVYHSLKSISKVIRILNQSVPNKEINNYFDKIKKEKKRIV